MHHPTRQLNRAGGQRNAGLPTAGSKRVSGGLAEGKGTSSITRSKGNIADRPVMIETNLSGDYNRLVFPPVSTSQPPPLPSSFSARRDDCTETTGAGGVTDTRKHSGTSTTTAANASSSSANAKVPPRAKAASPAPRKSPPLQPLPRTDALADKSTADSDEGDDDDAAAARLNLTGLNLGVSVAEMNATLTGTLRNTTLQGLLGSIPGGSMNDTLGRGARAAMMLGNAGASPEQLKGSSAGERHGTVSEGDVLEELRATLNGSAAVEALRLLRDPNAGRTSVAGAASSSTYSRIDKGSVGAVVGFNMAGSLSSATKPSGAIAAETDTRALAPARTQAAISRLYYGQNGGDTSRTIMKNSIAALPSERGSDAAAVGATLAKIQPATSIQSEPLTAALLHRRFGPSEVLTEKGEEQATRSPSNPTAVVTADWRGTYGSLAVVDLEKLSVVSCCSSAESYLGDGKGAARFILKKEMYLRPPPGSTSASKKKRPDPDAPKDMTQELNRTSESVRSYASLLHTPASVMRELSASRDSSLATATATAPSANATVATSANSTAAADKGRAGVVRLPHLGGGDGRRVRDTGLPYARAGEDAEDAQMRLRWQQRREDAEANAAAKTGRLRTGNEILSEALRRQQRVLAEAATGRDPEEKLLFKVRQWADRVEVRTTSSNYTDYLMHCRAGLEPPPLHIVFEDDPRDGHEVVMRKAAAEEERVRTRATVQRRRLEQTSTQQHRTTGGHASSATRGAVKSEKLDLAAHRQMFAGMGMWGDDAAETDYFDGFEREATARRHAAADGNGQEPLLLLGNDAHSGRDGATADSDAPTPLSRVPNHERRNSLNATASLSAPETDLFDLVLFTTMNGTCCATWDEAGSRKSSISRDDDLDAVVARFFSGDLAYAPFDVCQLSRLSSLLAAQERRTSSPREPSAAPPTLPINVTYRLPPTAGKTVVSLSATAESLLTFTVDAVELLERVSPDAVKTLLALAKSAAATTTSPSAAATVRASTVPAWCKAEFKLSLQDALLIEFLQRQWDRDDDDDAPTDKMEKRRQRSRSLSVLALDRAGRAAEFTRLELHKAEMVQFAIDVGQFLRSSVWRGERFKAALNAAFPEVLATATIVTGDADAEGEGAGAGPAGRGDVADVSTSAVSDAGDADPFNSAGNENHLFSARDENKATAAKPLDTSPESALAPPDRPATATGVRDAGAAAKAPGPIAPQQNRYGFLHTYILCDDEVVPPFRPPLTSDGFPYAPSSRECFPVDMRHLYVVASLAQEEINTTLIHRLRHLRQRFSDLHAVILGESAVAGAASSSSAAPSVAPSVLSEAKGAAPATAGSPELSPQRLRPTFSAPDELCRPPSTASTDSGGGKTRAHHGSAPRQRRRRSSSNASGGPSNARRGSLLSHQAGSEAGGGAGSLAASLRQWATLEPLLTVERDYVQDLQTLAGLELSIRRLNANVDAYNRFLQRDKLVWGPLYRLSLCVSYLLCEHIQAQGLEKTPEEYIPLLHPVAVFTGCTGGHRELRAKLSEVIIDVIERSKRVRLPVEALAWEEKQQQRQYQLKSEAAAAAGGAAPAAAPKLLLQEAVRAVEECGKASDVVSCLATEADVLALPLKSVPTADKSFTDIGPVTAAL